MVPTHEIDVYCRVKGFVLVVTDTLLGLIVSDTLLGLIVTDTPKQRGHSYIS